MTPVPVSNPPGLDALTYRVGTHGRFLASMLADLAEVPALADLRARTPDDLAIALLDGWAVIADVLSFYTERIANEGYLRTATEHRSLLALGWLVGHRPRPGVAASTWLAFTLDPATDTVIPRGTAAASVPGAGGAPQVFETGETIEARAAWNAIPARRSRPTVLSPGSVPDVLYLSGAVASPGPGGRVLAVFGDGPGAQEVRTVQALDPEPEHDRTVLRLVSPPRAIDRRRPDLTEVLDVLGRPGSRPPVSSAALERDPTTVFGPGSDVGLQVRGTLNPAIRRFLYTAYGAVSGNVDPTATLQLLTVRAAPHGATARPRTIRSENGVATGEQEWLLDDVTALRVNVANGLGAVTVDLARGALAASTGALAPPASTTVDFGGLVEVEAAVDQGTLTITLGGAVERVVTVREEIVMEAPAIVEVTVEGVALAPGPGATLQRPVGERARLRASRRDGIEAVVESVPPAGGRTVVALDGVYEGIAPQGWALVERGDGAGPVISRVTAVDVAARSSYEFPSRVTALTLADDWLGAQDYSLAAARSATVFAGSRLAALADRPCRTDVAGAAIELDGLYDGLRSGRRMIVTGERTDVPGAIPGAETVMVARVVHAADPQVPGDPVRTTLHLASPLSATYRCASVELCANVVPADHGESGAEVLGSGDAAVPRAAFTLRRAPVTHLADPGPSGAASTLEVRVDEVRWRSADTVLDLDPSTRGYTTRVDEHSLTTVEFGDGEHGVRPPSGTENITASYRIGLGAQGNVDAGAIRQLRARPLGVSAVTNPLAATGGADPDGPADSRRTIPLALGALDRVVSVADHAAFALARSGIAKATARRLTAWGRSVVHLTVAGTADTPVTPGSALHRALRQALHDLGDADQPVIVAPRELLLIMLAARVGVHPDHRWEVVEAAVRRALLDRFGFARRELGQDVVLSDVLTTAAAVPGVTAVDVDGLGIVGVPLGPAPPERIPVSLDRSVNREPLPAQLALLSPDVPDTLILERLP
ncbi:putative baseplate assembly protein [Actinomycetospora cinnamomea]|uniref:Putative phage baseplate assembly protein n=1 Tax=Actinomycetospora cinnamomea TaxID=663609 RepID=A0A2U1F7P2_9PSEU|nr:putative baseplate assembly protein [Actinomycetospora cinnamomea]PVZ08205.1 putative phage baseplate assembly protein [Actinomycetospora cinnamomea]